MFLLHLFLFSIWRDVISLPTDQTKYLSVVAESAMDRHLSAKINPQIYRKLHLLRTDQKDHSWELTNLE